MTRASTSESKHLILLRHAKSSRSDSELDDRERPLSERGERDAPRMGVRLKDRHARPELLITSPAKRALRTAKAVARMLAYPLQRLAIEERLYLAPPERIRDVIAAQDDRLTSLLVVGHNPGLTELVNRLLPDLRLDNLPTGGVVAIDFAARRWADLGATVCRLAYYDYPKNTELFVTKN